MLKGYTEICDDFLSPYRDAVAQRGEALAVAENAHRAREAKRLRPFRERVACLRREEKAAEAALCGMLAFHQRIHLEEEAHLAPFRKRVADQEVFVSRSNLAFRDYTTIYEGFSRDAALARRAVLDAAAVGRRRRPREDFAAFEAAYNAERGILFDMLKQAHEAYARCWLDWQNPAVAAALAAAQAALRSEMERVDAPPLTALLVELARLEVEAARCQGELADARALLSSREADVSEEWEAEHARLTEALRVALDELEGVGREVRLIGSD